MNSRALWVYATVAALLGALSAWQYFGASRTASPTARVLPRLEAKAVTAVTIHLLQQPEIRLERNGEQWELTKPLATPAQTLLVEKLVSGLEQMKPAVTLQASDLKARRAAEEEFGFKAPSAAVLLEQPGYKAQVVFGGKTAPGDQCFVKVAGGAEVYVVDAALLQLLPKTADDLRDTALFTFRGQQFNRVAVNSGAQAFELERQADSRSWRMISPMNARADTERVNTLLQQLETVKVGRFVTDDVKSDLEAFGLQPPSLEILFKNGTNVVSSVRLGRSPTNEAHQVFAKTGARPSIVTVPREDFASWAASVNDFRSRLLVGALEPLVALKVDSEASFTVQQTNGAFLVLPYGWPADLQLFRDSLAAMANMRIVEFTKDVVTPADLPNYGLATPALRYTLYGAPGNAAFGTNRMLMQVDLGTNNNDRVYARRSDESSVYAVSADEAARLPRFPVQFRDRAIWDLKMEDLTGVTIRDKGKVRQLLRRGAHEWSLAPGSQGIINELAIEESVRPLCKLAASAWIAVGDASKSKFGFAEEGHQVVLEFKNGSACAIEFGGPAGDAALASVKLGADTWVFEMPASIYRFVATYLTIPAGLP